MSEEPTGEKPGLWPRVKRRIAWPFGYLAYASTFTVLVMTNMLTGPFVWVVYVLFLVLFGLWQIEKSQAKAWEQRYHEAHDRHMKYLTELTDTIRSATRSTK